MHYIKENIFLLRQLKTKLSLRINQRIKIKPFKTDFYHARCMMQAQSTQSPIKYHITSYLSHYIHAISAFLLMLT